METDGHGHEDDGHGGGGKHEHAATLEAGDDERDDDGVHQGPALVGDVDPGLCVAGGVAHHLEEKVLVV
jgi:hypothetical protein